MRTYRAKINKKIMQDQIGEAMFKYQSKNVLDEHKYDLYSMITRQNHIRDVKIIKGMLYDMFGIEGMIAEHARKGLYTITHNDYTIKLMVYNILQSIIDGDDCK